MIQSRALFANFDARELIVVLSLDAQTRQDFATQNDDVGTKWIPLAQSSFWLN